MREMLKSKWYNVKKHITEEWFGFKVVDKHTLIINSQLFLNDWFNSMDKKTRTVGFTMSRIRFLDLRDDLCDVIVNSFEDNKVKNYFNKKEK